MEILLVKWKEEYYEDFFSCSNDKELYGNMSGTFPHTKEECRTAAAAFAGSDEKREYVRAVMVNGRIAGCIAAFFDKDIYCKNAEIAYWLSKEERGKGIAVKVIEDFIHILFSGFDIRRIYARPFEYNTASCKVLEKTGFVREGVLRDSVYKDGNIYNGILYAITRSDYDSALEN